MSVLVTGGAGYVGGVVADQLLGRSEKIVVVDNLSRSPTSGLPEDVPFYQIDVGDREALAAIVRDHRVEACMHFAGLIAVGESVARPVLYFEQNVAQTIALLDTLTMAGVETLVFSSSAAVYGDPSEIPIPESHQHHPTSPYGASKSIVEQMLLQLDRCGVLRSISLRYFNAAGATEGRAERHEPETHLIPLAIDAALGHRDKLVIFGTDYDTPDGTAVRDYVDVSDLATAHLLALDRLRDGGGSDAFNLGNGAGYSVLEVVAAVARAGRRDVPHEAGARRPGDPPTLVASAEKARTTLGWVPQHPEIDDIVASAWRSRADA